MFDRKLHPTDRHLTRVFAPALCAVLLTAATCGAVVKVSLLHAALVREADRAADARGNAPQGEKPAERSPGTDPVLSLCTNGDWDRAAPARISTLAKPLPAGGVAGARVAVIGTMHPTGAVAWPAPRSAPNGVYNPNCRAHAPPSVVAGAAA